MGVFKSLGLSPAKKVGAKAFRRLFGRVLPAGESDSTSATGSAATSETGNGKNHIHIHDETNSSEKDLSNQQPNRDNPSITPSSEEPRDTSTTRNDQHLTATKAAPSTEVMASPKKLAAERNKENQPPDTSTLTDSLARLSLDRDNVTVTATPPTKPAAPVAPIFTDPAVVAERAMHMKFIEEALDMVSRTAQASAARVTNPTAVQARLALRTNETPVGCVLVHDGKVIARGMNATNVTRNGTRHAEIMALGALLSYPPKDGPRTTSLRPKVEAPPPSAAASDASSVSSVMPDEGNEDGSKGHLYPYGQKCHPDERVDRSIVRECILYVTVEPCVMCASLLRQLGIKKVYFGAVNDKFGGTGGVFSIHANSLPISADGQTASAHPTPKPTQLPDGSGTLGVSYPPGGGDGGNIESGYEIEGGWGRDDAVGLLRRFYVQENGRGKSLRHRHPTLNDIDLFQLRYLARRKDAQPVWRP